MDGLATGFEVEERQAAGQYTATVSAVDGEALGVTRDGCEKKCRRAASCWLSPEVGDRVLVAAVEGERWVLAVLERSVGAGVARVEVDGDLEFRAPKGAVTVAAREGVSVVTAKSAMVAAGELKVEARVSTWVLGEVLAVAQKVEAEVARVSGRYEVVERVAERVSERAKRVYRWVEDFERLRAKRVDWETKETLQVHAGDALITSEGLVKVDGEQIQLG